MKLKLHFYTFFYFVCGSLVAQTTFTINNINYETLTATTVTVTGEVTQTQEHELTIPNTVTNLDTGTTYTITQIKEDAFLSNIFITSVTLPNTLTLIGNDTFIFCSGLTSITVYWDTPVISANIFKYLTLATITLNVPIGREAIYKQALVWKDFFPFTNAFIVNNIIPVEHFK